MSDRPEDAPALGSVLQAVARAEATHELRTRVAVVETQLSSLSEDVRNLRGEIRSEMSAMSRIIEKHGEKIGSVSTKVALTSGVGMAVAVVVVPLLQKLGVL